MTGEAEQQDETTIVIDESVDDSGQNLDAVVENNEGTQEFDIVLAGQDEPLDKPEVKDKSDFILNRVMKKKDKLQDENTLLKQQLNQLAQKPVNAVGLPPDEYAYEDRAQYLQDKAQYDRQMLSGVVSDQLQHERNGHNVTAQEQERDTKLKTYAKNASGLKVRDFNETQDKAFDVLGDDFGQLIAQNLPEDAPKLIYYFGKNPEVAAKMRDDYLANPGNVTFKLGKLAGNLTIKPRESSAAQPESKIESGAVGGVNLDWQAELDKIDDATDMTNISKNLNARRQLKKRAAEAGFDTSTLK
jgi:hypothetical protein